MENAPSLLPSTIPASTAKNVCNVIGTPPTTINGATDVIFAPIAVMATNTLAVVILSADQFVFAESSRHFILSSYNDIAWLFDQNDYHKVLLIKKIFFL